MDTKEVLLASGYKRLDVEVAVGSYEEIPQLDPDLMHIRFILCHEGINANGDTFTKDVLRQAENTPKNKPVDWEHGQPIVGTILDSVYKEDANGLAYIEASGVIWKFIYPELSSQIKAKASTGELKLSMECYYKDANYKVGDQLFDQEQAEKIGIIPYVGREYMGKKVARVFQEVIFGGVGVVANPADKKAVFLSVAKDLGNLTHNEIVVNAKDLDNEEIAKAISEAVKRSVNDFKKKRPAKEDHHAVTIAKYVKAFDKAKGSVVAKFNANKLKTKEQTVEEVRNTINTLIQEVGSINNAYYRGVSSETEAKDTLQEILNIEYALNSENKEAYVKTVKEDYVIYDVIDYSKDHPDSISSIKASFTVTDSTVEIDFSTATDFKESEGNNSMKDKEQALASEAVETETAKEVVASQEVVEAEAGKKNQNDGDPEDLKDGGDDEDTEDKNGKPKKKASKKNDGDPEDLKDGGDDEDTEDKNGKPKKNKASHEEVIAGLQSQLEVANQKIAEFEAKFAAQELEKKVASRLAELKDAGIEISETRLAKEVAKLKTMSDEDFTDHKELLVEVAGKRVETSEEENESATASEEEVEEDIIVEGAKASAGLNIEATQPNEVRPFGHLARK